MRMLIQYLFYYLKISVLHRFIATIKRNILTKNWETEKLIKYEEFHKPSSASGSVLCVSVLESQGLFGFGGKKTEAIKEFMFGAPETAKKASALVNGGFDKYKRQQRLLY